jgi:glycosyltransferase involved in cell wall biosynthesis
MSSTVLFDATPLRAPENDRADAAWVRGVMTALGAIPMAERPGVIIRADAVAPAGFDVDRVSRPPGILERIARRPPPVVPTVDRADLVHLTSTLAVDAPAQIATCFDLLPLRFPALELGFGRASARRRYNDYLDRLIGARLVLVPTTAVAADLGELLAIPEHRIRVVPLAAPPVAGMADASRVLPPTVLVVANREPYTNADFAIRAMAASDPRSRLGLVIAGVGDRRRRDRLRRRAGALGVLGRVTVMGQLAPADLNALRTRATLAAVPSRADGVSAAALAAMAAGLPVVAGESPELDDVLGAAAMRLPITSADAWGDALSALAGDAALRARMAEASRARARERSWADVVREVRTAWSEAVDG